jgi:N-acetylneuraminic acid mutarotase
MTHDPIEVKFGAMRTLVFVALFGIGLEASTGVPALAQGSNTWTATGSMSDARAFHTATLLNDGQVLVAGGGKAVGSLNSAELYNPATAQWTATGSMLTARVAHTATLLQSGQVLVAGGTGTCTATAELYNPSTGQWTATGSMSKPRANHTATLLTDGLVLVAGGFCNSSYISPDNSAELYNPSTGTWKATGNMNVARVETAATLLPNGQVLISGGNSTTAGSRSAELYDPSTGNWTLTGSMIVYRPKDIRATLLPNGDVLVFGGTPFASSASEFYSSGTRAWKSTGQYHVAPSRSGHTLTLLDTGKALVAGGRDTYNILSYSRLYDPSTNSWPLNSAGHMNNAREFHTATLLANGQVLVTGGYNISNGVLIHLDSAELYTP